MLLPQSPHFRSYRYVPSWWAFLDSWNKLNKARCYQTMTAVQCELSGKPVSLENIPCQWLLSGWLWIWEGPEVTVKIHFPKNYPFMRSMKICTTFVIIQFIYFVHFPIELSLLFVFVYWKIFICGYYSPLLYILFTAFNFYSAISIVIFIYDLGLCVFLTKITNSYINYIFITLIFFRFSFLLFFLLILDMILDMASLCCPGWAWTFRIK